MFPVVVFIMVLPLRETERLRVQVKVRIERQVGELPLKFERGREKHPRLVIGANLSKTKEI